MVKFRFTVCEGGTDIVAEDVGSAEVEQSGDALSVLFQAEASQGDGLDEVYEGDLDVINPPKSW